MKKSFQIISVLMIAFAVYTNNPQLAAVSFASLFAFSQSWTSKTGVLQSGINLVPAIITDSSGAEIPPLTRAQKGMFDFLRSKGNLLTLKAFSNGELIWNPVTYYIRFAITALSGRQKIMSASTVKQVGLCNLDKGMLQQYYNFCYDQITIRYVDDSTGAGLSPAALAGYSSVLSSMAAGLRNGELIVSLNRQVQIETPIMDFGSNAAITAGGSRDLDGGELENPKVWQENLQVEVELNLAAAIPAVAGHTYAVEVAFQGVEARLG